MSFCFKTNISFCSRTCLFSSWILIQFCLFVSSSFSQSTAKVSEGVNTPFTVDLSEEKLIDITSKAQLFIEKGHSLSLDKLPKHKLEPLITSSTGNFFIPFSDNTYWFKWTFDNNNNGETEQLIQFKNELVENIEIYQFNDSLQRFIKTDSLNFITVRQNSLTSGEALLPFKLKEAGPTEIYVRLRSQRVLHLVHLSSRYRCRS